MSTNDLQSIQPGEGRSTVLTSALARIIDRLIVYHRGETTLLLTNYSEPVRVWLQKHIFFRDQVTVSEESASAAQVELGGGEVPALLHRGGAALPAPEARRQI